MVDGQGQKQLIMAQIMNKNRFIPNKNTLDDRKMLWIFKYTCRHFRKCIVYTQI